MRVFHLLSHIITMIIFVSGTQAFLNNCKGSVRTAKAVDCNVAIARIVPDNAYPTGTEFSYGTCYLIYRSGNSGFQYITGRHILEAIHRLYERCPRHHGGGLVARGSQGTGNCDRCHVTINFRQDPGVEYPCPPC